MPNPDRVPVRGIRKIDGKGWITGPGTVAWSEHNEAWEAYSSHFGSGNAPNSALIIAERGGFLFDQLQHLLGRNPRTWEAKK